MKEVKPILLLLTLLTIVGCKAGGSLSDNSSLVQAPLIDQPIILTPTSNTTPPSASYYSNASVSPLTISGLCLAGDRVVLTGDSNQEAPCSISGSFSFSVTKNIDGVYSFQLAQYDGLGKTSPSTLLLWIRKSNISVPVISSPTVLSDYYSMKSGITLNTSCEAGSTISWTINDGSTQNDFAPTTSNCQNSQYSVNLPDEAILPGFSFSDGNYTFVVTHTDLAGNSAQSTFTWHKKAITVTTTSVANSVATQLPISIIGGSGNYNYVASGGTFDSATKTYTTGQVAGTLNTLTVTDAVDGASYNGSFSITPTSGPADHFLVPAQSLSSTPLVGETETLSAQLVDAYGNGVAGQQLVFTRMYGDATLSGTHIKSTDSRGYASITAKLGYSFLSSQFLVSPLSGTLPGVTPTVKINTTAKTNGSTRFGLNYATQSTGMAMAMGQFTASSQGDIVVASSDNSLGLLTGQGNGFFSAISTLQKDGSNLLLCPSGQMPAQILTGSFNRDSRSDLVIECIPRPATISKAASITVLYSDGNGGFGNAISFPLPLGYAYSQNTLVAADLNGDGLLDIAVAGTYSGDDITQSDLVIVYWGISGGTFSTDSTTTPTTYLSIGAQEFPVAIAADTMTASGKTDLLIANANTGLVKVLTNQGSGTFTIPDENLGTNTNLILNADLGLVSLTTASLSNGHKGVVALSTNGLFVFFGDGTGNFSVISNAPLGLNGTPNNLIATHLNSDTDIDIIVSNSSPDGTLGIVHGNGDGTFNVVQEAAVQPLSNDTLSATVAIQAYHAHGSSGAVDIFALTNQGGIGTTTVQELPSNGDLNSNAGIGLVTTTGLNTTPVAGVAADFGDGHLDLAVVNQVTNSVSILTGSTKGTFSLKQTLVSGSSPVAIATADLRHNGILDLVVVENVSNSIGIFLGKGDGTFGTRVHYNSLISPTGVVIEDFNRDGILDIAVADSNGGGEVTVYLGKGDGTFNTPTHYTIQSGPGSPIVPVSLAAADFNGDGNIDIVTVNVDGSYSALMGQSSGIFADPTYVSLNGVNPAGIITGDFNNDGKVDIAIPDLANSNINILFGWTGGGSFNLAHAVNSVGLDSPPNAVVAGNFSGVTGATDLIATTGNSNTYDQMNATLSTSLGSGLPTVIFGNYASSMGLNTQGGSLSSTIVTDINHDGKLDLIIIDSLNNQIITLLGQ